MGLWSDHCITFQHPPLLHVISCVCFPVKNEEVKLKSLGDEWDEIYLFLACSAKKEKHINENRGSQHNFAVVKSNFSLQSNFLFKKWFHWKKQKSILIAFLLTQTCWSQLGAFPLISLIWMGSFWTNDVLLNWCLLKRSQNFQKLFLHSVFFYISFMN